MLCCITAQNALESYLRELLTLPFDIFLGIRGTGKLIRF